MFARVTTMQASAGKLDALVRVYEKTVLPAAAAEQGFRGTYLLTDRGRGKCVAMTFWETEDDAMANEASGYYQEQVDKVRHFLTTPPMREGYEVAVQDTTTQEDRVIPMAAPTQATTP